VQDRPIPEERARGLPRGGEYRAEAGEGRLPALRHLRAVAPRGWESGMSTLVLELRAGDLMVVNGASLRFRTRTRVELVARARFLFGKQVMSPESATTPARRIYFALQCAYVGPEEERESAMADAHRLIGEFQEATTSNMARQLLDRAITLAEGDEWYQALRLVRHVIRHEATVLGLDPSTGTALPPGAMEAIRAQVGAHPTAAA
jgi:flagellar protein FlbT